MLSKPYAWGGLIVGADSVQWGYKYVDEPVGDLIRSNLWPSYMAGAIWRFTKRLIRQSLPGIFDSGQSPLGVNIHFQYLRARDFVYTRTYQSSPSPQPKSPQLPSPTLSSQEFFSELRKKFQSASFSSPLSTIASASWLALDGYTNHARKELLNTLAGGVISKRIRLDPYPIPPGHYPIYFKITWTPHNFKERSMTVEGTTFYDIENSRNILLHFRAGSMTWVRAPKY